MMIEDVDEVYQHILNFNIKNMEKSKPQNDCVAEIQALKDEMLEEMFQFRGRYPQTIPWDVYVDVIQKVYSQNKAIFCDFLMSGPRFKLAIFVLLNRIYVERLSQRP